LDLLHHITEPSVGYDVCLGHTTVLVKGTKGETAPAIAEFDAAIGVRMHAAPLTAQIECLGI
jgi:hypothetical protein